MNSQDDDNGLTLAQLATRHKCHNGSLVDLLLDISEHQVEHGKFSKFLRDLRCLARPSQSKSSTGVTQVRRNTINAFDRRDYTALSYTWDPSESQGENAKSGGYEIETHWDREQFRPSEVRDCVFERAFKYMHAKQQRFLWIDRECIQQEQDCNEASCGHQTCQDKQEAIQTMDQVYKRSRSSVALLSTPIKSVSKLDLLHKVLKGMVDPRSKPEAAVSALMLLDEITNDRWWTRAWTFQEQYCAGMNMDLLIPHHQDLENKKKDYRCFGRVEGELCINLVKFSGKATSLCQDFQQIGGGTREEREAIKNILGKAGKYTDILESSESMFPRIISDIEKRDVQNAWDRLAIIANCCQYPRRLNVNTLRQQGKSLSLSILAMCLLNGEVFNPNSEFDGTKTQILDMTVSKYLKHQFFGKFVAPKAERALSFNKGCRFPQVELDEKGVTVSGYIWKLGKIIDTGKEFYKSSCDEECLSQLAGKLNEEGHGKLISPIYNSWKPDSEFLYKTFSEEYKGKMAQELVSAIHQGKLLQLGCLWDGSNDYSPYRAIFIWNNVSEYTAENEQSIHGSYNKRCRKQRSPSRYAFTAIYPRSDHQFSGSGQQFPDDIDCHVSLEVDFPDSYNQTSRPKLYAKGWLLGLCFFENVHRTEFTFPWPSSLMG